jgi:PAS domain S-box-containing protein
MSAEGTIPSLNQSPGGLPCQDELLDLIFQHSTTGLALADPGGRFLHVSPSLCRLLGCREDELLGQLFESRVAVEDQPRARELFALAGRRGTRPGPLPWSLRRNDGHWVPVLVGADGITVRDGRSFVLAFFTEVEGLRELHRSQGQQSRFDLVSAVDGIIWEIEFPSFRCTFVSPQIERILGFPPRAWLDDPDFWPRQLHPEDRDRAVAFCKERTEQLSDSEFEYRMIAADGRVVWLHDRVHVVVHEGRPVRLQGVMVDITARKVAEAEQANLQQRLQTTQRHESIAVLAGGIAHDFNNLLTGIAGFTGLARAEVPVGSAVAEYLDLVEQSTRRAADLCRQMLAYSGQGKVVVEPIDLSRLVGEMENLLRSIIPRKATLEINRAPNLPLVLADAAQMRQIVMNLVSNASDALQDRPGTLTVSTGTGEFAAEHVGMTLQADAAPLSGPTVWLRVADTGSGISPEIRDRIFDPFFTTKFVGRGLGLSAVLGIVRGHHGALRIESTPGQGSVFEVFLPVLPESLSSTPEATSGSRVPATSAADVPPRPRTVLVIEDEAAVRSFLKLLLERLGYRVLLAVDGEEGVSVFARQREDIWAVLLDLMMPRRNGRQTLGDLRKLKPGLPVILMSGYSEEEIQTHLGGQPVTGFLQKPFAPATVQAVLAKIGSQS